MLTLVGSVLSGRFISFGGSSDASSGCSVLWSVLVITVSQMLALVASVLSGRFLVGSGGSG